MKTAREMFEDLGYEETKNNEVCLEYERDDIDTIIFWKSDKTFFKQYYIEAGDITLMFLTFAVYITVDTYYSIKERKK